MKTIELSKQYDLSCGANTSQLNMKEPNGLVFMDYPGLMSQDTQISSKAILSAALVSCGLIQEDLYQITMQDTVKIISGFSNFLQASPKIQ